MYREGEGVEEDAVQAAHWYRKATVHGYAQAQYSLGLMYDRGEGVKKDAVQAVHWWQKAAVQGYADAQTHSSTSVICTAAARVFSKTC
jgi:TPR repeat protein